MHRLITIAFSHYNEKARWALDYCGVPYQERRYMPGFSQLAVYAATRGRGGRRDKVSTKLSTPVLITDGGETLCDSTDIARWAAEQSGTALFPTPEVLDVVTALGTDLGPYTRLCAYYHVMRVPRILPELATNNVGRAQALAFRAFAPLGKRMLARALTIDTPHAERALAKITAQLDQIETRLARGPYLVGKAFTAADLTFAALMAPALAISHAEGYGASLPAVSELPSDAQAMVAAFRARPSGAFALEMFRRHRHAMPSAARAASGGSA